MNQKYPPYQLSEKQLIQMLKHLRQFNIVSDCEVFNLPKCGLNDKWVGVVMFLAVDRYRNGLLRFPNMAAEMFCSPDPNDHKVHPLNPGRRGLCCSVCCHWFCCLRLFTALLGERTMLKEQNHLSVWVYNKCMGLLL